MGFSAGTDIFDSVVGIILFNDQLDDIDKKQIITALLSSLGDHDWDTEDESEYWEEELVQECFAELYDKCITCDDSHMDFFDDNIDLYIDGDK